jgi:hypothetical protein
MSWDTMSWQDVIRDVEAGGSNPLTPTKSWGTSALLDVGMSTRRSRATPAGHRS